MNNPKKIIFKFKNKNRRIQYHTYIYIGPLLQNNNRKIIESFKDKTFYETLIGIKKKEIKILTDIYSQYWYKYFFNFYHLEHEISKIKNNQTKKNILKRKFGSSWIKEHINDNKTILPITKHSYQFDTSKQLIYKIMINRKNQKKFNLFNTNNKLNYRLNQKGGNEQINIGEIDEEVNIEEDDDNIFNRFNQSKRDNDIDSDSDSISDNQNIKEEEITIGSKKMPEVETNLFDNEGENEINLETLEAEFLKDESDENIKQTSKLIDRAIEQGKLKKETMIVHKFPEKKNEIMYDENLKNSYSKSYIYSTYLFEDDSIKKIKKKISISLINNPIFIGSFKHNNYLIPSRMYLYAKHKYKNKFTKKLEEEKIMIGQKWIIKNELLDIDTEPFYNLKSYENLKNNMKYLASNIVKTNKKIRREDNQNYLFEHYKEYVQNNELYMIDIYNDLGINYGQDLDNQKKRNLYDTYIRIYFPEISFDEFKKIIDYLKLDNTDLLRKDEINYIRDIYETNKNDLFLEHQITSTVEKLKVRKKLYKNIIKYNYILQAVIHILLDDKESGNINRKKVDLFRIFDNFIVNEKYPFVQWHTSDGSIIFKYYNIGIEKKKDIIISKWMQHTPYGLSFKVKTDIKDLSDNNLEYKYISFNLNENGRLEYKTQYKEANKASIDNVYDTYNLVNELLRKINNENKKINFIYPKDNEYKFAFINSIIKFELPKKKVIDHNKLSELCRYFYPYIVLVIEPRKREGKTKKNEASKYGTYIRYKRIDNYDTEQKIELKIIFFLKNYEFNLNQLAVELSKQYNITEKQALNKINEVKSKFNIRRVRKVLKKLNQIPKFKTPGIEIEIQGKNPDNYKIRISGVRNKNQLDKIINFLEILIFLYYDTYVNKSSKRVKLLETLKVLHNIAKRRNQVTEFKQIDNEKKKVKLIAKNDPDRLGFKPKQGQDHWSRACQNSGKNKRRQPDQILSSKIHKLTNKGFKLNKDTNMYEKEVTVKINKSKEKRVIRAIKQKASGDYIYYVCTPENNGKYIHIGFLNKAINPSGLCMPCCFKIDQFTKYNNPQRDFFLKCIDRTEDIKLTSTKIYGEKLYILQDTNKIQEGRYGFLPKYLDNLLNKNFNKTKEIDDHYLVEAESGYLFKYGIDIRNFHFLNCMKSIFNIDKNTLINKIIKKLRSKPDLFYFLNAGDTKARFKTLDNFEHFLETSTQIKYNLLSDIFLIPGIFDEFGYNIIIFEKEIINIEDEKKTRFIIRCPYKETRMYLNYNKYKFILIYKVGKIYYPIIEIIKQNNSSKFKIFKNFDSTDQRITFIKDYLNSNCNNNINTKYHLYSRNIIKKCEDNNIKIIEQIVNRRNKCKFINTKYGLIPTVITGTAINYKINFIDNIKIDNLEKSFDNFMKINKILDIYKFNGFSYIEKKGTNYKINGILLQKKLLIPIKEKVYSHKKLEKLTKKYKYINYQLKNLSFDKVINTAITSNIQRDDERVIKINIKNFEIENYNLFKLELSEIISKDKDISNKIMQLLKSNIERKKKKKQLKLLMYKILDNKLFKMFKQIGGKIILSEKFKIPTNYEISNTRELCNVHKNKVECEKNNCFYKNGKCNFRTNNELAVLYINKIVEEVLDSKFKANELLQIDEYFISDIVDYNSFTARPQQTILKSNSINANILLSNIYGDESIPTIGRKQKIKNINEITKKYNPEISGNIMYQKVNNKNRIFNALANGYYWIKNNTFNIEDRNLGYISNMQKNISNFIRGRIITWISNRRNWKYIKNNITNININQGIYGLDTYISNIYKPTYKDSKYITELLFFNIIFKISIYIINESNQIIFFIKNGKKLKNTNNIDINDIDTNKNIILKYNIFRINEILSNIHILYKLS